MNTRLTVTAQQLNAYWLLQGLYPVLKRSEAYIDTSPSSNVDVKHFLSPCPFYAVVTRFFGSVAILTCMFIYQLKRFSVEAYEKLFLFGGLGNKWDIG